jgi:CBS domain-containing protein
MKNMKVGEVMKQPFTVKENITLSEAAKLMRDNKIGSIIYIDKSSPVGILTESDVTKNFGKTASIKDVMSKKVVTIDSEDNLQTALEIMNENKIKRIPVVSKGKLVGIITVSDLLKYENELEGEFLFD